MNIHFGLWITGIHNAATLLISNVGRRLLMGVRDRCTLFFDTPGWRGKWNDLIAVVKLVVMLVLTIIVLLIPLAVMFGIGFGIGVLFGAGGFWQWYAMLALASVLGIGPYIFFAIIVIRLTYGVLVDWL